MNIKSFWGGLFRKSSRTEKTEQKETVNITVPFLGSELRSGKAEAMAYILSETVRRNKRNLEDIILCSEVYQTIKQLEEEKNLPTVYEMSPRACWNAFWEMGDNNQVKIVPQDGSNKAWMTIVPDSILAKMIWA